VARPLGTEASVPVGDQPDLTINEATDVMWLLMAPDHYARLVHDRGWMPEGYQRWLTEQIHNLCATSTPQDR
jgi:hypothetical protein